MGVFDWTGDGFGDWTGGGSSWWDLGGDGLGGALGDGGNSWTDWLSSGSGSSGNNWASMFGNLFGGSSGSGSSGSSSGIFGALLSGLSGAAQGYMSGKDRKEAIELTGKEQRKTSAFEADLLDYYKQKDKVRKRTALDTYGQFSRLSQFAPGYGAAPPIDMPTKPVAG